MNGSINGKPNALGVAEAAKYLGVSHYKITKFIKSGVLKAYKDLSDERHKLIRVSDLRLLKRQLNSPLSDGNIIDEEKGNEVSAAA